MALVVFVYHTDSDIHGAELFKLRFQLRRHRATGRVTINTIWAMARNMQNVSIIVNCTVSWALSLFQANIINVIWFNEIRGAG